MGKLFGWRNTNQILRIGVVNAIAYDQIGGPGWDDDDDSPKGTVTASDDKSSEPMPSRPSPSRTPNPRWMPKRKSARKKSRTIS